MYNTYTILQELLDLCSYFVSLKSMKSHSYRNGTKSFGHLVFFFRLQVMSPELIQMIDCMLQALERWKGMRGMELYAINAYILYITRHIYIYINILHIYCKFRSG